jgi:hypothetical protein
VTQLSSIRLMFCCRFDKRSSIELDVLEVNETDVFGLEVDGHDSHLARCAGIVAVRLSIDE